MTAASSSPSKSSGRAKNVVIALLALWSIVSLIIIVVWATSPDLKSSAQCRAELHDTNVKLKGERVTWGEDRAALEGHVEEAREEQERRAAQVLLLLGRLNATNATLEECRLENVILSGNITALQEEAELLRQREANLTAELEQQRDHIEALEQNVTQAFHLTESCYRLKDAAEHQMMASQAETRGCRSKEEYLQRQLQKCKIPETEVPQTHQGPPSTPKPAPKNAAAAPLAGLLVPMLLVCSALRLITCEYEHKHLSAQTAHCT